MQSNPEQSERGRQIEDEEGFIEVVLVVRGLITDDIELLLSQSLELKGLSMHLDSAEEARDHYGYAQRSDERLENPP